MGWNLRYGGEALFFIGVAIRLAVWLFRTAREVGTGFGGLLPDTNPPVAPAASMTPDQHARAMSMISPEHRCAKCGALIHTDLVHGGFGPCRKCGWSAGG